MPIYTKQTIMVTSNTTNQCDSDTMFPNGTDVIYCNPGCPSISYGIGTVVMEHDGYFLVIWKNDGYSEFILGNMLKSILTIPLFNATTLKN